MILVLAGTRDGRDVAAALTEMGWPVVVAVVSGYGRHLAKDAATAHTGSLDCAGMAAFIRGKNVRAVVDASHPYAVNASRNAQAAAAVTAVPYLRFERPEAPLPAYDRLHQAVDAAAAAVLAASLGRVIFLTTGSRTLAVFKNQPLLAGCRLIARVLPEPDVVAECRRLGFLPRDIVAMQGPFSPALNAALFREYAAEVVVSKNSGLVGGADSKFAAAAELGLHLVVISRPQINYSRVTDNLNAVVDFVREVMK